MSTQDAAPGSQHSVGLPGEGLNDASGQALNASGQALNASGQALNASGEGLNASGQSLAASGQALTQSQHGTSQSGQSIGQSGQSKSQSGQSMTQSGDQRSEHDSNQDMFVSSQQSMQVPSLDMTYHTVDKDFVNAKAFLLQASTLTGLNLYDHLARVLTKVLDDRPDNAVDVIEDVSREAKQTKFTSQVDTVIDKPDMSAEVALAEIQMKLFGRGDGSEDDAELEEAEESPLGNVMEQCFYFEQAGVGLSREEMIRICLAMKTLVDTQPLEHCRFWGKIFGIQQNYVVAEVEFREGEGEEEEEEEEGASEMQEKEGDEDEEEEEDDDEPPKPSYKPAPVVPKEDPRTGCNKKTYFVCNEPGKLWTKLPNVTPLQISTARKIKKFFTGNLDAPIVSYPPFPGNETSYLRAQIARISAATHISPVGFYQFDEEAEEEEEGAVKENFIINTEWEPIPVNELIDSSLANWVHHVPHILKQQQQGRVVNGGDHVPLVKAAHFELAFTNAHPSVSELTLEKYERFARSRQQHTTPPNLLGGPNTGTAPSPTKKRQRDDDGDQSGSDDKKQKPDDKKNEPGDAELLWPTGPTPP